MTHLIPALPYDYSALEPHIDARTMHLHHDKHHAAYVAKLNAALAPHTELRGRTASWLLLNLTKIPDDIRAAVHHNAGGHVNHSLFWQAMAPGGRGAPTGSLAAAIDRSFGSLGNLKAKFVAAGTAVFGSGWVWLAKGTRDDAPLEVLTTSGHDNPGMKGRFPLLLNDVWEHAYYLKYEDRRADYLQSSWSVVNWEEVNRRFERSGGTAEERWENEGGHLLSSTT